MKKCLKKLLGFTISEALIVLVVLGIIGVMVIPALKTENPTKRGWDTLSIKMAENFQQATVQMLAFNASLDNLTILKQGDDIFSVADPDVTPKMADLYKQYLSKIEMNVDTSKPYFSQDLLDYKRQPVGGKIGELYSNFYHAADGILVGFRFYGNCTTTEENANPPENRERYNVTNICGSIFYDVNSYKHPNKLGSDQYILPIGEKGIQYDNGLQ